MNIVRVEWSFFSVLALSFLAKVAARIAPWLAAFEKAEETGTTAVLIFLYFNAALDDKLAATEGFDMNGATKGGTGVLTEGMEFLLHLLEIDAEREGALAYEAQTASLEAGVAELNDRVTRTLDLGNLDRIHAPVEKIEDIEDEEGTKTKQTTIANSADNTTFF